MDNKNIIASFLLASAAFFAAPLEAAERPPSDARPLSEIVALLERSGYGPIVEIEFDDGRWEVEAYRQGRKFDLKVDPHSGAVLSERPEE
ncbi:PepSY domain-containing protein [Pseudothauera rhizosphaerae]|uniref:PepSY domain-containing protein n=1 Tax=Pseudothauera rhizosphaerae TaxID=2565932 RepID=A0A4S4AR73_9RHOO|nr:PepSY domain-containing protein [Pseudothauera rhizosphaerae]THF62217.1 PepSY domain-containing protein [Pseudothauera rhizosphaerae]